MFSTIKFLLLAFLALSSTTVALDDFGTDNPYCNICGRGNEIGAPLNEISIPTQGVFRCELLEERSRQGYVPVQHCHALKIFAGGDKCGCRPKSPSMAPSMMPSSAPSIAPSEESEEEDSALTTGGGRGSGRFPFRRSVGGGRNLRGGLEEDETVETEE